MSQWPVTLCVCVLAFINSHFHFHHLVALLVNLWLSSLKWLPMQVFHRSNFALVLFRISVKSLICKKSLLRFLVLLLVFLFVILLWSLQTNPFPGHFFKIFQNTEDVPLDLVQGQNLILNKTAEAPETSGVQHHWVYSELGNKQHGRQDSFLTVPRRFRPTLGTIKVWFRRWRHDIATLSRKRLSRRIWSTVTWFRGTCWTRTSTWPWGWWTGCSTAFGWTNRRVNQLVGIKMKLLKTPSTSCLGRAPEISGSVQGLWGIRGFSELIKPGCEG